MKYLLLTLSLTVHLVAFSQSHVRLRAGVEGAIGLGKDISATTQTVGNKFGAVSLGLAKNGFMLAGGVGLFKMNGTKDNDYYVPVYGEFSYLVQREKFAPFFGMKIGKLQPRKYPGYSNVVLSRSTTMYNPSIGLAIDFKAIYLMPYFEYLVPADYDARFDTFGMGLRIMTH